jgi:hypothetical protein
MYGTTLREYNQVPLFYMMWGGGVIEIAMNMVLFQSICMVHNFRSPYICFLIP